MSEYWQRIRDEADRLGTDGCTMGSAAFRDCCARHDLEYRSGATIDGDPVTKHEADVRFRSCMQSRSRFGWFSPMAWTRYGILKLFGQKAWDAHAPSRAKEAARRAQACGEGDTAA